MNAISRLSRFGITGRERVLPAWKLVAVLLFERGLQWRGLQWLKLRPQIAFFAAGVTVALLLLIFSGITAAVAAVAAWIALMRHFAQTNADRQRRITESFSKAVEQLGSDKLEVRLGGIYSLERISKESPDDYWTVMENLTAFVRERSRRNEAERTSQDFEQRVSRRAYFLWREARQPDEGGEKRWAEAVEQEELGEPPAADIAAVLTVIKRRSTGNREREAANAWCLDLSGAVLRRADLEGTHLEEAKLSGTRLEGANLLFAQLERADLEGTHFERAELSGASLERAYLARAHLEGVHLYGAHLEGADLKEAHLEGVDLRMTGGQAQLAKAYGDARTYLPARMTRPAHWPPQAPDEDEDTA